ncbi:MAG: hypothetical protein ACPGNV_07410 [Mangrovicoccus sp.]
MQRLIITGTNGTGKSHLAGRLEAGRPDLPVISYDALRLTSNWVKKPAADIESALAARLAEES